MYFRPPSQNIWILLWCYDIFYATLCPWKCGKFKDKLWSLKYFSIRLHFFMKRSLSVLRIAVSSACNRQCIMFSSTFLIKHNTTHEGAFKEHSLLCMKHALPTMGFPLPINEGTFKEHSLLCMQHALPTMGFPLPINEGTEIDKINLQINVY